MSEVTFNVEVTMPERWVDDFCSFLKCMEMFGTVGHSGLVGFYADGDGDFRPKFEIDRKHEPKAGIPGSRLADKVEIIFDAG